MIKILVTLLTGAITSIVLAALDHLLAAAVVAIVTVVVAVTLVLLARRGLRRLVRTVRGDDLDRRPRPSRVR